VRLDFEVLIKEAELTGESSMALQMRGEYLRHHTGIQRLPKFLAPTINLQFSTCDNVEKYCALFDIPNDALNHRQACRSHLLSLLPYVDVQNHARMNRALYINAAGFIKRD